MATNLVFRNNDSENRVETLAATYGPGVPVLSLSGAPAVTVTASGDYTITESEFYAPYTISGIPAGGVGLEGKEVTLAFDGTWEFDAAAFGGTLPTSDIDEGDKVYITSAGALTTTATGNTLFGTFNYPKDYDKTRGFLPIRIGAV